MHEPRPSMVHTHSHPLSWHAFAGTRCYPLDLAVGWAEREGAGSRKVPACPSSVTSSVQRGGHSCVTWPQQAATLKSLCSHTPSVAFSCVRSPPWMPKHFKVFPALLALPAFLVQLTAQKHQGRQALPPSSPQILRKSPVQGQAMRDTFCEPQRLLDTKAHGTPAAVHLTTHGCKQGSAI